MFMGESARLAPRDYGVAPTPWRAAQIAVRVAVRTPTR
jgi:hypothetical protein